MEEQEIHLTFHQRYVMKLCETPIGDLCLKPLLHVRISYGSNFVYTDAMVDSGSDYSAFPKSTAISLGIPRDELIPVPSEWDAYKGSPSSWYCTITITLAGCSFDCRAVFLDNPEWFPVIERANLYAT